MKRKLTALFLATIIPVGGTLLLASCGNQGGNSTSVTTTDSGNVPLFSLPVIDVTFTGDEYTDDDRIVNVAFFEGGIGEYTRRSLKADLLDKTDVDVATRNRDQRMKEELGLEIQHQIYIPNHDTPIGGFPGFHYQTLDSVLSAIASNTCNWDIIVSSPIYANTLTQTGRLTNLADLKPWNVDYLDLDASWWSQSYNDAMSYKGNYFWITGDLSLRYTGGMYATFVNQRIYDDLLTQYGSIYTIAKEGQWTIDLMTEMATACVPLDSADGFVYESSEMINAIATGMGAQYSSKDPETGEISITIFNQRSFDSARKLKNLTESGKQFPSPALVPFDHSDDHIQAFAEGTALFSVNTLIAADQYLTDMKDEYAVLPLPKYNAKEEYRTAVSDEVDIFAIPLSSQKIPQAAAALEWMCAYSSRDVAPLFFEKILKGKYTRDPEAAMMMDIIHDNVYGDFVDIWSENIARIDQVFYGHSDVSIKRRYTNWTNALSELTGQLDSAIASYQAQKEGATTS